jgi:hypothetical protein
MFDSIQGMRFFRLPLLLVCLLSTGALQAALPAGVTGQAFYDTSTIRFKEPIWFGEYPGVEGSFMVAELTGNLHILEPEGAGFRSSLFSNIRVAPIFGNDGLLGLAFHPDFKKNHKYYVYYNSADGRDLEERTASASFREDAGLRREILHVDGKNAAHNGGDMHFGPDGLLYLSIGDGGNPNVYNNRAQDLRILQGKMLRIDVDRKDPGLEYGIPLDNPFADRIDSTRREIYAYGLRQPWRWTFDAADGRLIAADVGDWVQEEVDLIRKGGNYGWSRMEAAPASTRKTSCSPWTIATLPASSRPWRSCNTFRWPMALSPASSAGRSSAATPHRRFMEPTFSGITRPDTFTGSSPAAPRKS